MTALPIPKGLVLSAPTLPALVAVTCPECLGEGYHEHVTDLGVDYSRRCETCFGAGEVEVCSVCCTVPTVRNGVDVCGCPQVVELGQVA